MRTLALLLLLPAGVAMAQADPAADHYRAGVTDYRAGKYAEAIQEFRAADAIRPSAALSFNVAQCYEKMADLANAKAAYQDYLRRAPNADDRPAVEATIASIDQQLATQQNPVLLVPATPALVSDQSIHRDRGQPNYTLGAVAAGVGVAGLIAGIVMNSISHQNGESLLNQYVGGGHWSQGQMQTYYNNAQNLWTGALVGYIAGGVLTAAGVGFLGYQYATRPPNP